MWVNSENARHPPKPFGGVNVSGFGREGGDRASGSHMEAVGLALATETTRLGA